MNHRITLCLEHNHDRQIKEVTKATKDTLDQDELN
jgi:hypothetical protein